MQIKIEKDYLSYKNGRLFYKDIDCLDLVEKYGEPLKVGYTDIIREKILNLKQLFDKAIKKYEYGGKYFYANANKASYYSENIITAGHYSDMYETSSYIDLKLVERVISKKIVANKKIICNGVKDNIYLNQIIKMLKNGFDILVVIDNLTEFDYFLSQRLSKPIEIGFRVNLPNIYNKKSNIIYDRFGLLEDEFKICLKMYNQNSNLLFTTLHFHQRGSLYDEEKSLINIDKMLEIYSKIAKNHPTLKYLDLGGGVPYDKEKEFNYQKYCDKLIAFLKKCCQKYKMEEPHIIQENGRYTVSDSCFNIYKVERVKKAQDGKYWYVINGSIMTSFVNTWALKEKFLFLPINLVENKLIKVRLGGDTCDSDDVYFYQDDKQYLLMPQILEGQTLYIGVFGCGAYQEILAGIGGIHHCLNPEENDLIIYKQNDKNVFYKIRGAQSEKSIYKRLNYLKTKEMKRYKI